MKPRRLRQSLAVLAAGSMLLTLAACGGSQPSGSSDSQQGSDVDAASAGASVWGLTGGTEAVLRSSLKRWNEGHSDEQIASEWFANDAYKEKIRTSVGSGNAPTLILSWGGGTLADYVADDAVVDLTDQLKPALDEVFDSVVDTGRVDGDVYAVPMNQSQPIVLYYNKELFDEAGISVPTTYAELLDAVETFKSQDVIPIALAGQSVWPELMYIEYLVDRIGGPEVFEAVMDGEQGAWSDPAMVEALTKIQELVEAGAFGEGFNSTSADGGGDTALVYTGRAAMVLQGAWVYPNFEEDAPDFVSAGKLGYADFPAVEGGSGDEANLVGNPANYWSVSAAATDDEQQVAIDYLLSETYSDESVQEFLDAGTVPPLDGLDEEVSAADDSGYLSFVYDMIKSAPHFQLSWDQALPPDQAQALLDNLSKIFLGQITPQQFVDAMNATL
ncbi:MAG TPA: extracellular solute-binding protein [Ruania sp.]|nr:extracellular solute-binding protein [Ruania sp.]